MASFSGPGSLVELAAKDRFGDRIHLWLACGTLATLPLNGQITGVLMIGLVIWGLVRTVCWRSHLPTGPRVVMIPALVWVGYLLLSLLWSPDLRTGWHQVWAQTWLALPPLLWPLMNRWRLLLLSVLVGTLVQSTFHASVVILDGFRADGWGFAGFDSHPRRNAVWYAAVSVGLIAAYLGRIVTRPWWLLGLIPTLAACLLSESRGGVLAILLGTSIVIVLLAIRRALTRRSVVIISTITLVAGGTILVSQNETIREVRRSMSTAMDAVTEGKVEDIRIAWWRSCVRQWETRPILGFGIGGTQEALAGDLQLQDETRQSPQLKKFAIFNQPHSVYFQTLLEGGIVGVMLLGWLLGTIGRTAYRTSSRHPIGTLAMGSLAVWMVTALFDQWHAQGQVLGLLWFTATLAAFDPNWLDADSETKSAEAEY